MRRFLILTLFVFAVSCGGRDEVASVVSDGAVPEASGQISDAGVVIAEATTPSTTTTAVPESSSSTSVELSPPTSSLETTTTTTATTTTTTTTLPPTLHRETLSRAEGGTPGKVEAFDAGGDLVAVGTVPIGGGAGSITVYRVDGTSVSELFSIQDAHSGGVLSLKFDAEQKTLYSGGEDGSVALWDVQNDGEQVDVLEAHITGVVEIEFVGDTLVTAGRGQRVKQWESVSLSLLDKWTLDEPATGLTEAAPGKRDVIAIDEAGSVYQLQSGLAPIGLAFLPDAAAVQLSANGNLLVGAATGVSEVMLSSSETIAFSNAGPVTAIDERVQGGIEIRLVAIRVGNRGVVEGFVSTLDAGNDAWSIWNSSDRTVGVGLLASDQGLVTVAVARDGTIQTTLVKIEIA